MHIRLVVALALIVAACSGGAADDTSSTTTDTSMSTTTTEASTTTSESPSTTIDDRPRSPINGMPVEDPDLLERRVLAVKIDNHWNAQPQSGILESDGVLEIRVEGGLTRFMTVFHSADSEHLGPIRSGRPSDATLIRPFEAVLAISGGQPWIRAGISDLGTEYISDSRPGMFRVSERFAPHNLYGNTLELREVATDRGLPDEAPPVSLWPFGDVDPTAGEEATDISVTFSNSTTTNWVWDGTHYLRSIGGGDSEWVNPEGDTERIAADVLVAIVGEQYTASSPTGAGSSVPATSTIGSGPIHVFSEGRVVTGTWERESAEDPFVLTTEDGDELTVPAGWPWISIVPDNGGVEWDNPPVTTTTTTTTDG